MCFWWVKPCGPYKTDSDWTNVAVSNKFKFINSFPFYISQFWLWSLTLSCVSCKTWLQFLYYLLIISTFDGYFCKGFYLWIIMIILFYGLFLKFFCDNSSFGLKFSALHCMNMCLFNLNQLIFQSTLQTITYNGFEFGLSILGNLLK